MPTLKQIRWLAFFFALFFTVTAVGQYLFVRYEIQAAALEEARGGVARIQAELKAAEELGTAGQAVLAVDGVPYFYLFANDGSLLDASPVPNLGPDILPPLRLTAGGDEVFRQPVRAVLREGDAPAQTWDLLAHQLDQGVAVVGLAGMAAYREPDRLLRDAISEFGETLAQARQANPSAVNASIEWALLDDNGYLLDGAGRIPLRADPAALAQFAIGDRLSELGNARFLTTYLPLLNADGSRRGTVVLPQEMTAQFHALAHQARFAVGIGLLSFVVFLLLSAFYSTRHEQEKREIRAAFQNYFSPQILEAILKDPSQLKLGGTRREVTILFSDIRSFTALAESLPPEELTHMLQEYFTEMTEEVYATEGIVDKYIGDAIMAFWGAPVEQPDQADRAVRTATNMMKRMARLKKKWAAEGKPVFDIGIGINLGVATVGNLGAAKRFDYTLVGDAVNAASRLESLNKEFKSHIIISESTRTRLTMPVEAVDLGEVAVRGKSRPMRIFEVVKPHDGE